MTDLPTREPRSEVLHVRVTKPTVRDLTLLAEAIDVTVADIVRRAIRELRMSPWAVGILGTDKATKGKP